MKSSSLFKECKCATFCQKGNSCKFILCSPAPKSHSIQRSHLHQYGFEEPWMFIKSPLHILLFFPPLKAAYQNLPVVFLSSYPKNIIKNEVVNTTI